MRDATHKVLRPGAVKNVLHGVWLGHPLHPALAQLPVGAFLGAAVLDATGDRGPGARRLIGFGVAASLPAALAGLADYADAHEEQQRVGVVHAAANSTAAEVPHSGPADWTDLGPVDMFAGSEPVRATAGLIPVLVLHLVLHAGEDFVVLHDRCSHMAAPLHQGELLQCDGAMCLRCPWHGSVFRVADGAVVDGPATAPQPVLDSRIRAGRLEAKVREIPGVAAS